MTRRSSRCSTRDPRRSATPSTASITGSSAGSASSGPRSAAGILLSAYLDDPVGALCAVGATTLWQEWQLVDQELVHAVHSAGSRIVAWTVNEVGDLEHLARLGVDGLCGNYPDRIRVALAARVGRPRGSEPRLHRGAGRGLPRLTGGRALGSPAAGRRGWLGARDGR